MNQNTLIEKSFIHQLKQIVGASNCLTEQADCWVYGYDNSKLQNLAGVVVFPSTHQQVVEIIQSCNQFNIPITARGSGTGTSGAAVPETNGLVLSFERFNCLIEINTADRYAVVEAGLSNQALQTACHQQGFFWAPDPTSAAICTLGGNLAYNSAGPRAVKYGTPRENTLALKAVTGDGRSLECGTYTTKGVVGYDLTRLLLGSEGTLAIITEAVLKLTPLPEEIRTLQAVYRDINSAAKAVSAIMSQPIIPCALEFIDGAALKLIQDYIEIDLPAQAGALLMIEIDGHASSLDQAVVQLSKAASNEGLIQIKSAETAAEKALIWKARKALSPALRKVAPKKLNEDVVVPVSNIPNLINGLAVISKQHQIQIVNFGHAGNGNIHVNLLFDPDDPMQLKNSQTCLDAVFKLVLSLKGSLSGEHGVGRVKREAVRAELDLTALQLMHQIKQQFDPKQLLNPHKTFPSLK